jgi:hypothetical protein
LPGVSWRRETVRGFDLVLAQADGSAQLLLRCVPGRAPTRKDLSGLWKRLHFVELELEPAAALAGGTIGAGWQQSVRGKIRAARRPRYVVERQAFALAVQKGSNTFVLAAVAAPDDYPLAEEALRRMAAGLRSD